MRRRLRSNIEAARGRRQAGRTGGRAVREARPGSRGHGFREGRVAWRVVAWRGVGDSSAAGLGWAGLGCFHLSEVNPFKFDDWLSCGLI